MAALFYYYSGRDVFKTSIGGGATPVHTDLFDQFVNSTSACILTSIGVTNADIIQFFTTFDDYVHYYYFGQGVGSIRVSGIIFMNCDHQMPGLHNLYEAIGQKRGTTVQFAVGDFGFSGVLTDFTIEITGEPETMASFTANFGMIAHNLPGRPQAKESC